MPSSVGKAATIKVKLNQGMAGHLVDPETGVSRQGFTRNPGDVIELPEAEAKRYIERGYASLPENK